MVTRLPCVVTELSIVKKKRKKFAGIPFSFLIWLTVHLTAFSADESSAAPYFAKSAVYGVAPRLKVWIYPATLTHTTGPRTTGHGGAKPTADLAGRGPEETGEKSTGEP